MIERILKQRIESRLFKGKAILLMGPRQVGKTTLVRQIVSPYKDDMIWLSGDDANDRVRLSSAGLSLLKSLIGRKRLVVVDEAQRIDNIGLTLKLMVDHLKEVQVLATGSSSFELANSLNEPLTGRKYEFLMFPLSFGEMAAHANAFEETGNLENRLIYGSYPEVVTSLGEEKEKLSLLSDSYLYKDLLTYEKIKKPVLLSTLLKALALQLGNEVSYNELAQVVGADKQTVEHYIDLLEKTYIVFRLGAFSRNIRNELKKSRKVYFYDNGIRNAIIGNFTPLENRTDKGALWENYLISERWKKMSYQGFYGHRYFWRTTQQQEIDYLEEADGNVAAFEFKWDAKASARFPKTFLNAYPVEATKVINHENYPAWLLD
ncbi:ATP-binding protein [uncultured Imperialibacter sp.]|uniref:ATP-binding protein n=1 Tax=uncultured Imperialibacter sp. TaxID=1672639 RepID=UPI0030DB22E6